MIKVYLSKSELKVLLHALRSAKDDLPPLLEADELQDLRAKLKAATRQSEDVKITDWIMEGNELISPCESSNSISWEIAGVILEFDPEETFGEVLFRCEDGRFYTVGFKSTIREAWRGEAVEYINLALEQAIEEGNTARTEVLNGYLTELQQRPCHLW
jgi:hypothetical protein